MEADGDLATENGVFDCRHPSLGSLHLRHDIQKWPNSHRACSREIWRVDPLDCDRLFLAKQSSVQKLRL